MMMKKKRILRYLLDMNDGVGVLLTESTDEHLGGLWGQKTGHILDGEGMGTKVNQLSSMSKMHSTHCSLNHAR